jgi:hypothetical protein
VPELLQAAATPALNPSYSTIDFPGAVGTAAVDINTSGQIVGEYMDSSGAFHGFSLSNGVFSEIDFPGAVSTRAWGINRSGAVVGPYSLKDAATTQVHGYMLSGGSVTTIDFPAASQTAAQGINSYGDVVGFFLTSNASTGDGNATHGFLLHAGSFTSIDFPGANFTEAWRITDDGEILGRYRAGDGKFHIYLFANGSFTPVPGVSDSVETAPLPGITHIGGFNAHGDIASNYCSATPCKLGSIGNFHGFVRNQGVVTTIDFPGAALTAAFGLNSSNDVVGLYQHPNGAFHGYLRTP